MLLRVGLALIAPRAGRAPLALARPSGRAWLAVQAASSDVPRAPTTVPWSKETANTVSLIGNLGQDPNARVLPSGTKVCSSTLAVSGPKKGNSGDSERETDWYELNAWDDENGPLATQMQHHCRKGQKVHVRGRIKMKSFVTKDGREAMKPTITVRELNFVESMMGSSNQYERPAPPQEYNKPPAAGRMAMAASSAAKRPPPVDAQRAPPPPVPPAPDKESWWQSLYNNYGEWEDYRRNPNKRREDPDFVHKDKGWELNLELDVGTMPADVYNYFHPQEPVDNATF